MIELVRNLRLILVLAKFENDPWKSMDVRVLTGLVCPAARPLGVRQYPGALKGSWVKTVWRRIQHITKTCTQFCCASFCCGYINTLKPKQNGWHFAEEIFKCLLFGENVLLIWPTVNTDMNTIDISWVRYHISRAFITIVWSLWHHQQSIVMSSAECKPSEWDMGTMSEDRHICRHLWICYIIWEMKWCMYSRDKLFMHSLECYFGVYFPCCCATQEINTKITPLWAHKQFVTWLHTSFYIHFD